MNGYEILDGVKLNSFIGEGTKFKGEFELEGLLRIDGDFTGSIKTQGRVLINGRAECDIYAGKVVIGGVVKGNIVATECVEILSSGMVVGDITAPSLIIEEGVLFCGNCRVYDPEKMKESELLKEQESNPVNLEENKNTGYNSEHYPGEANTDKETDGSELKSENGIYTNYLNNENVKNNDNELSEEEKKLYIENKY